MQFGHGKIIESFHGSISSKYNVACVLILCMASGSGRCCGLLRDVCELQHCKGACLTDDK
jgi:hypothetical protein